MENENNDGTIRRPTDPFRSVDHLKAIRAAGEAFLATRGGNLDVPTAEEVHDYLQSLASVRPRRTAHAEFSFLQAAAAEIWGTAETAFFARVLREYRVSRKPASKTPWERVEARIAKLPTSWQSPLIKVANASAVAGAHPRGLVLSSSRLQSIVEALARWAVYCGGQGLDLCPTGQTLKRYAEDLCALGKVTKKSLGAISNGSRRDTS